MANDFDKIINSFMQGKSTQNLNIAKSILSTDENREIISSLVGNGDVLKKAVTDAKNGNTNTAKALLNNLSNTPGGAKLISDIVSAVEGKNNG